MIVLHILKCQVILLKTIQPLRRIIKVWLSALKSTLIRVKEAVKLDFFYCKYISNIFFFISKRLDGFGSYRLIIKTILVLTTQRDSNIQILISNVWLGSIPRIIHIVNCMYRPSNNLKLLKLKFICAHMKYCPLSIYWILWCCPLKTSHMERTNSYFMS